MHERHVEGQTVIEARWAEARYDRLPAPMAEVLERKIDVLVTYGAPVVARKGRPPVQLRRGDG
jgi:hypothetical protein